MSFQVYAVLDGNTPVAMSATDNLGEETNGFNGPLKGRGQVASRPWPAAGEGSVQAHSYRVSA